MKLMAKRMKEKFKTWGDVFDLFTERTIQKFISKKLIDGLKSPISIGKEANVFTAPSSRDMYVVKIYRLETCDFNRMWDNIKTDSRYLSLKNQRRKVIFAWAQREYRNLLKAREAGVKVPTPIAFQNHVLLMEHIGNTSPAPQLKDAYPKDTKKFMKKVIENMKKLHQAGLVHGDLSQFNILNHNETPVFIDFSQCTSFENPLAEIYLKRDLKNITIFFKKLGIKITEEELAKKTAAPQ